MALIGGFTVRQLACFRNAVDNDELSSGNGMWPFVPALSLLDAGDRIDGSSPGQKVRRVKRNDGSTAL
jgi:hypothetical protein